MLKKSVTTEEGSAMPIILVNLLALFAPFLLIPIISWLGHSEIVEEFFKTVVIFFAVFFAVKNFNSWHTLLFGIFFGLSESVLYLSNIFMIGNFDLFFYRIILTVPMHALTCLIIYLSIRVSSYLVIVGFGLAVAIHLVFNAFVVSLL